MRASNKTKGGQATRPPEKAHLQLRLKEVNELVIRNAIMHDGNYIQRHAVPFHASNVVVAPCFFRV